MIITVFLKTHKFVFISIVVRLSDTAVSDPVQQHVVCFCGPTRWAVVRSWPDDWQVRLLRRFLKTWGNTSSCIEVSASRQTKRVECQADCPLMWRRGRGTCSQLKQFQQEDGGTKVLHASICDEAAATVSRSLCFCPFLLWSFQVLNKFSFDITPAVKRQHVL